MPAPIKSRDWFDDFWDSHRKDVPAFLRNDSFKNTARGLARVLIEGMGKQATTPEGIRQIVAYGRILATVKAMHNTASGPDPSPDEVADAVERLVQRVKP